MKLRHAEQVEQMINKKVKVYVSGKKVERVLRRDSEGLYIRYDNERVSVRPDENTLDILSFLALSPKDAANIAKMRAKRQAKSEETTSNENEVAPVANEAVTNSEQGDDHKVTPINRYALRRLRKAYEAAGKKPKVQNNGKLRGIINSIPP